MKKTNKQLIKKLTPDTVGESFLIEAVSKYCQTVLEDDTNWGSKTLINKDLWQKIASENLQTIEDHYK